MASDDSTPKTIEIPLTQGYTAIVDEIDMDLADKKWYATPGKKTYYAVRNGNLVNGKRTRLAMHRVVLERKLGRPLLRNELVDHKDRNGLNNTRENLRVSTYSQNMYNSPRRARNKSGYKGVSYSPRSKRWIAKITVDKSDLTLGSYTEAEEAAVIYNHYAAIYHGEFARLNDIEGWQEKAAHLISNPKPYTNNSSGYTGVTWYCNKWFAYIDRNKKRIRVGYYSTPEAAHKAREAKLKELFPDE